ncbi:hypothetical protein [Agrobacterium vitis]|uniref:hypothetical protein n=1 Tax=Agrobacterium vitis TaxID=373 RepID=UPI0012E8F668|nr:hypothetical protein [Agrobacterium vitis]MVA61484.1 hypothetical protein [Agrobacterium vitis]
MCEFFAGAWIWIGLNKDSLLVFASFLGAFAAIGATCAAIRATYSQKQTLVDQQLKNMAIKRIERISEEVGNVLAISRAWELNLPAEHAPHSMEAASYASIARISAMLDPDVCEDGDLLKALDEFASARSTKVPSAKRQVLLATQAVINLTRKHADMIGKY